ncbi:hypothetical protein KP509_24G066300 [Ceratopteris richardii]|uniref:Uncharacterized protein n=1 Tax=Ceratopteris richardii TaxID=49495 RepID=A0A8T2RW13_CERRI|nr:hypothetical protein KP509_24G066300 [Ceratopteris richardii]
MQKLVFLDAGHDSPGVVITGGSKGLGFALAQEFLAKGARVSICGRDEGRLVSASEALQRLHPQGSISFMTCDVSEPQNVARFADFSAEALQGNIRYWINNAGEVTSKRILTEVEPDEIVRASSTNVIGSILCCREAMRIMMQQSPSNFPVYHIFNMGFSRWGAKFTKSACTHKATKIALSQLTVSLNEEMKAAGITSIGVHNLSPGMVLTDLLLKDSTPLSRRFFNVLAEEPDTVAAALAPYILDVQGSGSSIEYLSPVTAFGRILVGFPQIFKGGRFFDEKGNRVQVDGYLYQDNGVRVLY